MRCILSIPINGLQMYPGVADEGMTPSSARDSLSLELFGFFTKYFFTKCNAKNIEFASVKYCINEAEISTIEGSGNFSLGKYAIWVK